MRIPKSRKPRTSSLRDSVPSPSVSKLSKIEARSLSSPSCFRRAISAMICSSNFAATVFAALRPFCFLWCSWTAVDATPSCSVSLSDISCCRRSSSCSRLSSAESAAALFLFPFPASAPSSSWSRVISAFLSEFSTCSCSTCATATASSDRRSFNSCCSFESSASFCDCSERCRSNSVDSRADSCLSARTISCTRALWPAAVDRQAAACKHTERIEVLWTHRIR